MLGRFRRKEYALVIGVDPAGAATASQLALRYDVPLVYLSFEIFFRDELYTDELQALKDSEVLASQHADLVLIQDRWRMALLQKENQLHDASKFFLVPVAPAGLPSCARSSFLRERFRIDPETRLVLHAGSVAEWTFARELAESMSKWPDGFDLVIHTRYHSSEADPLIKLFAGKRNVHVSLTPLNYSQLDDLYASSDIGLSLYKPWYSEARRVANHYVGKNIQTIGMSSGKFAFCARQGLPILSVNQASHEELLREYNFGVSLASLDGLPQALRAVEGSYTQMSDESRRLFLERLDFRLYWPGIRERLHALCL